MLEPLYLDGDRVLAVEFGRREGELGQNAVGETTDGGVCKSCKLVVFEHHNEKNRKFKNKDGWYI